MARQLRLRAVKRRRRLLSRPVLVMLFSLRYKRPKYWGTRQSAMRDSFRRKMTLLADRGCRGGVAARKPSRQVSKTSHAGAFARCQGFRPGLATEIPLADRTASMLSHTSKLTSHEKGKAV